MSDLPRQLCDTCITAVFAIDFSEDCKCYHLCVMPCVSMWESFNFQHKGFTLQQKPFTNTTAGLIRQISWKCIPQAHTDLLIFFKQLPLSSAAQLYFHTSKPNTKTVLSCTLPWAIVNIICILSISWCSYPEQLSVWGQAGGHRMLQQAVWSSLMLSHQHTLKIERIVICEQYVKDLK